MSETARKILVTAGAYGIGLAIAKTFHAAGDAVFVCDIDVAALKPLAAAGIHTAICDVSDRAAATAMVAQAAATLGGLDVLVNNAGIGGPTAPVETIDPAGWDAVLAVNLTGTFNITQAAIPHLRKSPAGVILIMSSLAGRYGYPNRSPYSVTKWGLIGLTKTLSIELGDAGIRVNAILPGAVDGPRLQNVYAGRAAASGRTVAQEQESMMSIQSIKRPVDPNDVAALCLFLASDAAKSISGQAIPIDNDAHKAS